MNGTQLNIFSVDPLPAPVNVPTWSPINIELLKGQNRTLFEYMRDGHSIHCMHPAKSQLGIGYLNSRISDLKKFLKPYGKVIYKRMIKIKEVDIKEYSLYPFEDEAN